MFTTQLMCTHTNGKEEEIEAEIECRLQQMTELHDFIKQQTGQLTQNEPILVLGDLNITALPLNEVAENLVRNHSS